MLKNSRTQYFSYKYYKFYYLTILEKFKGKVSFVEGGNSRQETVKNAFLSEYKETEKDDVFLVHDVARPFFEKEKLKELIETAKKSKAATLATPIFDTVKYIENHKIKHTIKREDLLLSQTPQAFSTKLYKKAIDFAEKENFICTDDCELVEKLNKEISFIVSSKNNFKITTKEDMLFAEYLMSLEKRF